MKIMLVLLIGIIVTFLLGIFALLILPTNIQFFGSFRNHSELNVSSGTFTIGLLHFGIQYTINSKNGLAFGPYKSPWFYFHFKEQEINYLIETEKESFSDSISAYKNIKKLLSNYRNFITFEECSIKGNLGFENPMITGIVFGIIQLIKTIFQSKNIDTQVTPAFQNPPNIHLDAYIRLRTVPIKLAWKYWYLTKKQL